MILSLIIFQISNISIFNKSQNSEIKYLCQINFVGTIENKNKGIIIKLQMRMHDK